MSFVLFFILTFLLGLGFSFYFQPKFLSLKICLSLLLGLSYILLTGYLFSLFRLFDFYLYFYFISAFLFLFFNFNKIKHFLKFDKNFLEEKNYILILTFISLVCSLFLLLPHYRYPWPLHSDEWWYAGIAKNINEKLSINSHPYFFNYLFNFKPGISIILGVIEKLGIDILKNWFLFVFLNNFLIFFIISLWLKNYVGKLSLILPVFLTALKSNAYFLGWWFFVPSTFGLLYFLPLILIDQDKLKNVFWLKIIFLATLLLIYPPLVVVILIIYFLMVVINDLIHKNFQRSILILSLILLIWLIIYRYSPYQDYFLKKNILGSILVPVKATVHFAIFLNIFDILPWIIFVLGFWGSMILKEEIKLKLLFAFLAFNYLIIILTQYSPVMFHQRTFQLLGIISSINSLWALKFLENKIKHRLTFYFLIFIIFILAFVNYFKIIPGTNIYYLINENNLKILDWLKDQRSREIVLAPPHYGTLISPYSRQISIFSLATFQSLKNNFNYEAKFDSLSCSQKKEIIKKYNITLVWSLYQFECNFLKEIKKDNLNFIYRVEFKD